MQLLNHVALSVPSEFAETLHFLAIAGHVFASFAKARLVCFFLPHFLVTVFANGEYLQC